LVQDEEMTTKLITLIIVVAVTVGLIGYDIFIVIEPSPNDTISEVLLCSALAHPAIAWLWGGLAGHLFWPMILHGKDVQPIPFVAKMVHWRTYRWVALTILILTTISLLILDVTGKLPVHPALLLVAGIPGGHWGWPQMKTAWKD
jgi:hypothetical protein